MKIYITRHGQVCPKDFFGSTDYPADDIPLSELGISQADRLGKKLRELGFKGKVCSSPYRRTMMTAKEVSEHCNVKVYPDGALREMFFSAERAEEFSGMTLLELKEAFGCVSTDALLEYPWWTTDVDTKDVVAKRLKGFWEALLENEEEDVLLVCHGASVFGTMCFLNEKYNLGMPCDYDQMADYLAQRNLNCSLSCIEIDRDKNLVSAKMFSTDYLMDNMLTSNANFRERPDTVYIK